ncbi:MAG: lactate utilization protein [Syntrophobacteraceae bacterium]|jgi:L-lactate dehydrogenase complex protein LldG
MGRSEDIAKFKEQARAVQTVLIEVNNISAAFEYAAELTRKQGGQNIAAPGITGKDRALLASICRTANLMLFTENLREKAGLICTGLTRADWGIAETATLVMDSKSEEIRIASMLSETHVALLPAARIVPDAAAIEKELAQKMKSAPCYLAFISGASRTADIERVLTIGAHGPRELHVLILREGSQ